MTSQELVEWSHKSLQEPLVFGSGEEWISKRKVATITKKNIEKSIKRQVVLEDGRVIEEDAPEVTVDTIEDTRTHENDCDEDKNILPGRAGNELLSVSDRSHWTPGDKILSEKQEQNINTQDMSERTTQSASGYNMGDLKSSDLEKVLLQGRSVRSVISPYETERQSLSIPAHITSTSAHSNRKVDKENIHEVQRINGEKVRTDRFVTKETAEDRGSESPAGDDSTEETESRDGDKRQFSRRKEDRYIDYYKVPKGRAISEGHRLGRGIHMTSHDVEDRPLPTPRRDKSLGYEKRRPSRGYPEQKVHNSRLNTKRWSIASSSQEEAPLRAVHQPEAERAGKVKRSMSFQSKESPFLSNGLREKPRKSKSFLGSLKSLYSSVLLLPQHPKEHQNNYDTHTRERIEKANKDWFEDNHPQQGDYPSGGGYENHHEAPLRPPRKYKSENPRKHPSNTNNKPFHLLSMSNFEMKSPNSTMERGRRHSRPKLEVGRSSREHSASSSHRSKPRGSPSRHHHMNGRHSPNRQRSNSRSSPSVNPRHRSHSRGSPSVNRHRSHSRGSPRGYQQREPSPRSRHHSSNRASPIPIRIHPPQSSSHRGSSPSSSIDRKLRSSPHLSNSSPHSTLERSSKKKRPTAYVQNIGAYQEPSHGPRDYNTASLDRRKPEKKANPTLSRLAQENYFSLDRKTRRKDRFPSSTLGRISKSLQNSFHRVASSPPRHPPPPPPTNEEDGYLQQQHHHHPQHSSTMKRGSTDSSSGSGPRSNILPNSGNIQRRQTFSTYDYNREPPRFEPERQQQRRYGSRFFGQDDSQVDVRDRPPPDMRRLLLNGVNESRRNTMSKEVETKNVPIRAV